VVQGFSALILVIIPIHEKIPSLYRLRLWHDHPRRRTRRGRLIGNVFGTSNLVWASIIGLILIYLTLGYFLGGKWADKNPTAGAMYRILAWGAFTIGLVPYIAGPVLKFAATGFEALEVGVMAGSFIAVLILFIVPITLLGTISPLPSVSRWTTHRRRGKSQVRSTPFQLSAPLLDLPAHAGHHPHRRHQTDLLRLRHVPVDRGADRACPLRQSA